jgi:hypothetical protein
MAIIFKTTEVNLFVSPVLFVFWYHSPNFLDTSRIFSFSSKFQKDKADKKKDQYNHVLPACSKNTHFSLKFSEAQNKML